MVDKLVEEYTENIEEARLVENKNKDKYSSCTLYIVLFSIIFTINIGIGTYYVYSHWYLKKMMLVFCLIRVLKQQFIELADRTT